MKGRKPTPSALVDLRGNPGKRVRKANEPKPAKAGRDFEPPPHLPPDAQEEWRRVVGDLAAIEMVAKVDRAALAAYCAAYARWKKAEERIAQTAELVTTPNGSFQISPWVSIANRSMELMHKFLIEFGMTPASRVRLGTPPAPPVDPTDPNQPGSPKHGEDLDTFIALHPDRTLN